jgi:hypothetical protein
MRAAFCCATQWGSPPNPCTSYQEDAALVSQYAYRVAENPRLLGCELCGGDVAEDATLLLCPECLGVSALLGQAGVLPVPMPTDVHTAQAGSEKARAQGVSR